MKGFEPAKKMAGKPAKKPAGEIQGAEPAKETAGKDSSEFKTNPP